MAAGFRAARWEAELAGYDDLAGIDWEWQAVAGVMPQAPFGGAAIGPHRTDRAKRGVKRSLLTDSAGIPLAVAVAGANGHDMKLLAATLDGIAVARPDPNPAAPQRLCLDALPGHRAASALAPAVGTPAGAPKACGRSPGRPQASRSGRATRYPALQKAA